MRESAKNAMRSGVVVVGALAFGYLTLQIGFKPFLQKAQYSVDKSEPSDDHNQHIRDAQTVPEGFSEDGL